MARISISKLARATCVWGLLLAAACSGEQGGLTGPAGSGTPGPSAPGGSDPGSSGGLGSITLAWDAPAQSEDGTPLTDLAGYTVYYGSRAPLTKASGTAVDVGTATRYTLSGLVSGSYIVAVAARDDAGNEGPLSASIHVEVAP